jgi:hypothetical protein
MTLEEQARQASTEALVHNEKHWQARLLSLARVLPWWNEEARLEMHDAQCCYQAAQTELARRSSAQS